MCSPGSSGSAEGGAGSPATRPPVEPKARHQHVPHELPVPHQDQPVWKHGGPDRVGHERPENGVRGRGERGGDEGEVTEGVEHARLQLQQDEQQ